MVGMFGMFGWFGFLLGFFASLFVACLFVYLSACLFVALPEGQLDLAQACIKLLCRSKHPARGDTNGAGWESKYVVCIGDVGRLSMVES